MIIQIIRSMKSDNMGKPKAGKPYFQKQGFFSNKCGVCALNNLFGSKLFDTEQMNQICDSLCSEMINPYKSIFGGDYDVTVLICALESIGYEVKWLKPTESIESAIKQERLKGFLINKIQKRNKIAMKLLDQSGRHWMSVKQEDQTFFLFDSKEEKPQMMEKGNLINVMEAMFQNGAIILSVFPSEAANHEQVQDKQASLLQNKHNGHDHEKEKKQEIMSLRSLNSEEEELPEQFIKSKSEDPSKDRF